MIAPTEEELLDILVLRLAQVFPAWALLEDVPDITDVLEPHDVGNMEQEMKRVGAARRALLGYAKSYWHRRRVHNGPGGGAGGAGGGGAPRRWKPAPNCRVQQHEVAPYMPPGASIWRNNVVGAWAIHVGPFYRSFSWAEGPTQSATTALQSAWRLHFLIQGDGLAQCPILELFPEGSPDVPSAEALMAD